MKEYGIVDSGDAATIGIGAMTDARMKSFYDKMVRAGVAKPSLDARQVLHAAIREQEGRARSAAEMMPSSRCRREDVTMRALLSFSLFLVALSAAAAAQKLSVPSDQADHSVPARRHHRPVGRLVAEGLRAKLNQPVIVENKPGAQGMIGLRELLKADPDGYTLMAGTVGSVVIGYAMEANPQFDPMRDLVPIAGTAEYATAMVVNNKTPVNSVKEFIDYAKARPGKLSFGSTGVGAMDYLAVELFMRQTGTSMVHVPYRGGPAALQRSHGRQYRPADRGVSGGHGADQVRPDQGARRQQSLPAAGGADLPTFKEAGVSGVELTGWLGVYGPPRLPEDVRATLGKAIVEVVKQPDVQAKFRAIGFEPTGLGVKEFSEFHAAEVKRWVAFISEIGLRK